MYRQAARQMVILGPWSYNFQGVFSIGVEDRGNILYILSQIRFKSGTWYFHFHFHLVDLNLVMSPHLNEKEAGKFVLIVSSEAGETILVNN